MGWLDPGQPVRKWLTWAAWCYGLIVRVRAWGYHRGWFGSVRLPCRVISVGNVTVGGTGKTPMVILLTEWLQAKGHQVAILSRGYRRISTVPRLLVSDGTKILGGPSESGDEPFLIAHRCPQAIVAVGADRAALGRWVLEQFRVDCMILDDGFQHRTLHRDVDLVLVDATDVTGLDAVLPAGRLREPLDGLDRASAVLITRADSPSQVAAIHDRLRVMAFPSDHTMEVVFEPACVVSVVSQEQHPISWGRGKNVWLVSGIGNSLSFRRSAESIGMNIIGETTFADHYSYSPRDIQQVRVALQAHEDTIALTTEKDAVKLLSMLTRDDPWWALRLHARVVTGEHSLRRLVLGDGASS